VSDNEKTQDEGQAWEEPTVTPLGSMAKGHGEKCQSGNAAGVQCMQGPSARQSHCRDGSAPPTGSCGKGGAGTD